MKKINKKYSDEFKLMVVNDYYNSPIGVRAIAMKYNLPSKNYINNWEDQLKKKGLLPPDSTKPNKTSGSSNHDVLYNDTRTPREKQYEAEIIILKTKLAYLESLESLKPFLKKKLKIRELKYKSIMKIELEYPIWVLCEVAGISRASYYKYKNRKLNKNTEIDKLILDIYNKSNKRFGYRSIKYTLENNYNLTVNHKKIQRIMKENNIQSIVRKKFKKIKEKSIIKKDLLNRDFDSNKPGRKFVTDITYIPTRRKMTYLCTVIDLFNNEPVAWKVSDSQTKSLSIDTIKMLSKKFNLEGSIIHSDQGVHYTNNDYVDMLEELKVKQSMSRKGNCWDNAKAESFFGHYKCETIHIMKNKIKDLYDVKQITEEYMDYYINQRPQKKFGGIPPNLYKQRYLVS